MWKNYVSISIGACISFAWLQGQGGAPMQSSAPAASPGIAQPAQGNNASMPTSGLFESNTFLEMANRVFDPSSDSMDFEDGNFNWKGKNFNLVDQRAFRSRLERFLLSSPSEQSEEYSALMESIMDQLSVENSNTDESISAAWGLLFEAGEYPQDGGNSVVIANQVYNAWRIRSETRGVSMSQAELEDLKSFQRQVAVNRERLLQRLKDRKANQGRVAEEGAAPAEAADETANTEEGFRAADLAETDAKIAALEAQTAANGLQAKLQFQSQIVAFITQRRFQHALLLSSFYQLLFKGSHQQLEVGGEDMKSFFPGSDLSFTVDTLSMISREAINDINGGVESILAAFSEDRKLVALERMQETFFLGENLPVLDQIELTTRRDLLDLYRNMLEARELAEAKDYQSVLDYANKLGKMAKDFPLDRIVNSVEAAMSISDMAVFAASQYRNLGSIDQARDELRNAIEIWPSNPAIREFQLETTKLATAGSQGERIFDDLFERGDMRGIYERRMELGFALSGDEVRRPKLLEVIDQVATVEMYLAQAAELKAQGEDFAAWELLEMARKIDADDSPMNRARAELAPRVANFVGAVDRAAEAESDRNYASALTAYLAAQDTYPASRICRLGIERSSTALMANLSEQMNAERAEMTDPSADEFISE